MVVQSIVLIVSIVISAMLINKIQQVFMNLIGADVMFFNGKFKIVWILLVGFVIFGLIGRLLGWAG